jgi:hypothetical protein
LCSIVHLNLQKEQMEAIRVRLTDGAPAKRMKQVCTPGISAKTICIIGWALMNDFADEKSSIGF